jgi:hypothetical protein
MYVKDFNDTEKPECKLIGEDGNVFNLIGLASRCLKANGLSNRVSELQARVMSCGSYEQALEVIGEYVDIV